MIGDIVAGLFIYNFVLPLCFVLGVILVGASVLGSMLVVDKFNKVQNTIRYHKRREYRKRLVLLRKRRDTDRT